MVEKKIAVGCVKSTKPIKKVAYFLIAVYKMIVRYGFKCLTCGHPHTLRIGLGQEDRQVHRFPCRDCGEDLVIVLELDHDHVGIEVEPMENGELIRPVDGASIVNLEANFTVPAELQDKDFVFPRMDQFDARTEAAERNGSLVSVTLEDLKTAKGNSRPFRRPDFDEEWKLLKKTW